MARFKEFQFDARRKPILINIDDISSILPDDRPGMTIINFTSGQKISIVVEYQELAQQIQATPPA